MQRFGMVLLKREGALDLLGQNVEEVAGTA
jgi:hypothetical protein